ncbi:Uma2 family endonuclease [Nitrosococcus wardiae]|uniref:Uma2 family endonuclease n=1 Tax=Nitrosococcus wardiae TaxID=1814290 RepID=A0A4V1AW37_9GAMM|nr:Uma2 family endonuclease [Nitrosococcus wardiae]QBQ55275.1 Uma2 family endonuclease [Nitrosococcus wardiae]
MSGTAQDLLQRHRLTISDYHRMGEAGILHEDSRIELIEGELLDMAPIGSQHAGTVKQLSRLLHLAIGQTAIVSTQDPIILDKYSEPEPDIMLLQPRDDFYKSSHPRPEDVLLIIEVADTSLQYDRHIKIPLYAEHGIPEVWLVDLVNKALTLFRSPRGHDYREAISPPSLSALSLKLLPTINLDLSDLF